MITKNKDNLNSLKLEENKNVVMCEELLAENNLYEIYQVSKRIPFSKTNKFLLSIFSIASLVISLGIDKDSIDESIPLIATTLIGGILTALGFLIAGYTIFCSVFHHKLSMELYNSQTKPYGFSQLKYSHLLFMRVFFYYLAYVFFLIIIIFFSKPNYLVGYLASKSHVFDCLFLIINYITYNILFIFFTFLILQLASFIFNIYHSIMTSICLTEINK